MYYSYVMGVDETIYNLEKEGFEVIKDGNNYMVSFPESKVAEWEIYIRKYLKKGYWNEYLTDTGVIFNFHLADGIHRYNVQDYENSEVLQLCEKLCGCKFESIKKMLQNNHFYNSKIK